MTTEHAALPAVPIPGLAPDSLGNYLASLGILRLLARKWPSVRIAWREEILQLVGGPATLDELLDEVAIIGAERKWTPYERGWAEAQKKSSALATNKKTSAHSGFPFALWQAEADEGLLELFSAHVVPHVAGRGFNPLLGSGGNAGRRDFPSGWKQAADALASSGLIATKKVSKERKKKSGATNPTGKDSKGAKRAELKSLLLGEPTIWLLEKLNAGSWFSDSNKLYNSGQKPYRDGLVSPWSMALACEGLTFLAGSASRRLGTRARAKGAFPFVTHAAAPEVEGEAGRDLAEFWAPLWERPMTVPEVGALFARGRAELHGRGALTPSAFATAIVRRGVDAGISEFRRFVLGRTTSANTFEPRFEGAIRLPPSDGARASSVQASGTPTATALARILNFIERLPADRKVGKRWRFVGLRGPTEAAAIRLAAAPNNPELARALLDSAVAVLDQVDRNRSFREKRISWEPLPMEWLPALFVDEAPSVEARLAMALVSGFPASRPLALYRFGVEWKYERFEHPQRPTERWTWGPGALPRVLSAVLLRRMLDWESGRKVRDSGEQPARVVMPTPYADVSLWLNALLDEDLLARWISRLALFDWRFVPREVRMLAQQRVFSAEIDGTLCLFGLFQPLFDLRPLMHGGHRSKRDLLDPESGARTASAARVLAHFVRTGQIDAAVRFAGNRYAMAEGPLARTAAVWHVTDPERLLASLLFTISDEDRWALIKRWLRPQRQEEEHIYV